MGHPRETNLPHDMGLPRPELAGREMGRVIYHMTWDFQGRNGTSKAGTSRLGGNMYHRSWELAGRETGRGILPQEMGHLRWELAGRETVRGICRRRWDIQGRRIYHMTWDFQGQNWQVGRWEEEFTTGDGTSKAGMGLPRPELAGWEETCTTGVGNWQAGRREEEFYHRRWDI